ncbi:hypothetical protein DCC79_12010 [bacterium]|nr:MAG: hypothetical protein DCC79_12010 [bacterium]
MAAPPASLRSCATVASAARIHSVPSSLPTNHRISSTSATVGARPISTSRCSSARVTLPPPPSLRSRIALSRSTWSPGSAACAASHAVAARIGALVRSAAASRR